ncbi:MAG: peptide chain release factor N(5)-glutamine methyltransferase [Clostridia bacterium]|nr:peptide chain release factor N(5)-glutamine methyltransferase [Clostridia bacterium]
MTIGSLLDEGKRTLLASGVPDAAYDASALLAEALQTERLSLLLQKSACVPADQEALFRGWIQRRASREPLQYILGKAYFCGRPFAVQPGVLIPRFDTESLMEEALSLCQRGSSLGALDLCTGSGALAITLALERPECRVFASDISDEALACAKRNAKALGADVRFLAGDLFEAAKGLTFDLIISNPPYIPEGDLPALQREVLFEPPLALSGGADGLDFYRRILRSLSDHLCPGGSLCLECGDGQAEALAALLAPRFAETRSYLDLNGKKRGVSGRRFLG